MTMNLMQAQRTGKRRRVRKARNANTGAAQKTPANDTAKPVATPKMRRMAYTPEVVEERTTVHGKPYLYTRGTLVYRRRQFTYTVMVPFFRYAMFAEHFIVGRPIEILGMRREFTPANDDGSLKKRRGKPVIAAYIEAAQFNGFIGRKGVVRMPGQSEDATRALKPHERTGHYRDQRYGPGNRYVKVIWIYKTDVNGGKEAV